MSGSCLPSPRTFARTFAHLEIKGIRLLIKQVYTRLKRNKALGPIHGFNVAVIDGHETSASFKQRCDGCLERNITKKNETVTQYYHRNVTLMLLAPDLNFMLDAEAQLPGEGETACAKRLFKIVMKSYPRAFNVILADALYATAPFINLALSLNKDVICVLKDDRRELIKDAQGLFAKQKPLCYKDGNTTYKVWDEENFTSWDGLDIPVRVVKSEETTTTRNRATGRIETKTSTWMWVSTISKERLSTKNFVSLAHRRWGIENSGFKELVHLWHGDHVYNHHPNSIIAFWLVTMLGYNIMHAFVQLNIKPARRLKHTFLYFTDTIKAAIYAGCEAPP